MISIATSIGIGFILYAFKTELNVFLTPTQLSQKLPTEQVMIRLGGLVKRHSIQRIKNTLTIKFIVTDLKKEVVVFYTGVPPDLFREGSGVIAEGNLDKKNNFHAKTLLAKHDEYYSPKGKNT